jgi:high-affinity iron transporter
MVLKMWAFVLGAILFSSVLSSTQSAEIEKSPRALVHLLEYLAKDYAGAVQNGKVISASEYDEQKEFAGYISEGVANLKQEDSQYTPIETQVINLKNLVDTKASADKVATLALSVRAEVLKISKIPIAPAHWPSLKNGQRVFESQCTVCHGVTGHGDGPAGAGLDPAPRDFFDASAMDAMTAFHIFNVTKLGIPGTGMVAFSNLTQEEGWDVAFYILSLRHQAQNKGRADGLASTIQNISLETVASKSDDDLKKEFQPAEAEAGVASLRLKDGAELHFNSIPIARAKLKEALKLYEEGKQPEARQIALMAYLDGVEPAEPKLKAADANMVTELEIEMATIRSAFEKKIPVEEIHALVIRVDTLLSRAEEILMKQESSPWLSFTLSSGIIFREGFEAILMILAILGVVRAAKAKRAALLVHAGWISAILLGVVAWFLSGFLIRMSGAQREVTEGLTSIFAVFVLLYMGFWLHQRTEIKKWTAFIDGKVKAALDGSKRWTLFVLAFVAVFREVFETVLFMRAVYLEGGAAAKTALLSGAVVALAFRRGDEAAHG